MIDDPYKVLGVPSTATTDEVKKAYRQKAKQYHPDMHPDDPNASEKMNEVNEAYDMIMNPEKYRQQRAQQEQQEQARRAGSYGGYGGYGGYGNAGQGGAGGFDFDFEELFRQFAGASAGSGGSIPRPSARSTDTKAYIDAIDAINAGRFQDALRILNAVMSTSRTARWYHLSAIANYCVGNRVAAWEQIQKAAAMAPNDQEYAAVKRAIGRNAQRYETTGRSFTSSMPGQSGLCVGICLANLFCRICCCR